MSEATGGKYADTPPTIVLKRLVDANGKVGWRVLAPEARVGTSADTPLAALKQLLDSVRMTVDLLREDGTPAPESLLALLDEDENDE